MNLGRSNKNDVDNARTEMEKGIYTLILGVVHYPRGCVTIIIIPK